MSILFIAFQGCGKDLSDVKLGGLYIGDKNSKWKMIKLVDHDEYGYKSNAAFLCKDETFTIGGTYTSKYYIKGSKIHIEFQGTDFVLNLNDNGCLSETSGSGKYCKQ
ncbi:MAG: hypothetical protein K1X86_00405 [Ignavibacteria bacterium]|nr:hypothetical protein [Ignavibacteria bacterium]